MIQALKSLGHNQFEYARWCEGKDPTHYKIIRVEVVREDEKRWSTVLQNLLTTSDSTVLRTAYAYPYQRRQHIFFRNTWWEIQSVGEMSQDVNPQSLALVSGGNTQCVLELLQVDGYDA